MNVIQWLSSVSTGSFMTATNKICAIGFEDILQFQRTTKEGHTGNLILINTLSLNEQEILICKTISAKEEEHILNELLETYQTRRVQIVIYGRNSADITVFDKQEQIRKLGFTHVYVYLGGLFEWLLLQDIYGVDAFKTTNICRDILKYSPAKSLNIPG